MSFQCENEKKMRSVWNVSEIHVRFRLNQFILSYVNTKQPLKLYEYYNYDITSRKRQEIKNATSA